MTDGRAEAPADVDWIARSDAHARVALDVMARFSPEATSALGVEGFEGDVLDLAPRFLELFKGRQWGRINEGIDQTYEILSLAGVLKRVRLHAPARSGGVSDRLLLNPISFPQIETAAPTAGLLTAGSSKN